MLEHMRKRLDVMISTELYDYIKEQSEKTGTPMNALTDELLAQAIATKRGEVIEQQSLPVIREIVQSELRKALAQHRTDFLEALMLEIKNALAATANRLAALLVMTARDSIIARRLLYTLLSRAYGADFAMQAYEDSRVKAGKEMSNRRTNKEESES
jgi:hypothetical protein